MARAFRSGVETNKKVRMPLRHRVWQPIRDLQSLTTRAERTGKGMGPLVEVPALVRIEDEHWIFERIDESTLNRLSHRLILADENGEQTLGVTENLQIALQVAKRMAEVEQRVVMIQPL